MLPHARIRGPAHLLLAGALLAFGFGPLFAQDTFVVDATGDGGDANAGDGVCDDGSGNCTLRAAIEQANATAGLDQIHFGIAGAGPHTIAPATSLPAITDPLVVDGYTQSGAIANTNPRDEGSNAVFMIVLDAGSTSGDGLEITAGGSTVRGLTIDNAPNSSIGLLTNGGNTVEGNHLLPPALGIGVYVETPGNTVGGTSAAARNVIGGGQHGVMIFGAAGNVIQGNLIGTDAQGTNPHGNQFAGVTLLAAGNTVGGTTPGAGNVISGNAIGIWADHAAGEMALIQGNLIGTDVTGTSALANTQGGLFIEGTPYTIGGTTAEARNVISGNSGTGIDVGDNTDDLVIQGNFVGLDVTGSAPIPNSFHGIFLQNDGHLVGGTEAGAGNVIAGSGSAGILVNSTNTTVQGNRIGTNAAGTGALANVIGVRISNATSNTIGGSVAGAANIIAGNSLNGVRLAGNSSGNTVEGNYIGTNAAGASLGNGVTQVQPGVLVDVTADGNSIARNTIAFNGAQGVFIEGGTGVHLSENVIHSNGEIGGFLGIDLGTGGVTANDAGDTDTGPNNLQNFPLVTLAYLDGGTVVEGTLNSAASTTFTLEFFGNSACDALDHGEGETFLGSTTVTTDGAGDASFTETLATGVSVGNGVAATATDPDGNTSEFSACVRVNAEPVFVVTSVDDDEDGVCSDGHCTLREAVSGADARPGADAIHFDIPGAGPHAIHLGAPTEVTDPVVIDGYTQPGASPNTNTADQGTNAVLMIEIDASDVDGAALDLRGGNSTVRGLSITNIDLWAIRLLLNGANAIEGNRIRGDVGGAGVTGLGVESSDNTIGGTAPGARNVIGDLSSGITINGDRNVVQGNLIGTDAAGIATDGGFTGISVDGVSNIIGGGEPGAGNVISGNGIGINLGGDSAVVRGNLIGTDVTGTVALGNTSRAMHVGGSGMHSVVVDNVMSGSGGRGILVNGDSVVFTGNRIGTDVTGTTAIPNTSEGIEVAGSGVTIGGTGDGDGNVVAFNGEQGVLILPDGTAAILGNAIHSNGGLGIDLGDDGVTANDPGDADTGANGFQNFPTLDFAFTGSAELEGTFHGAANATLRLEFFSSDACHGSGHGEGQRLLGFTTVTTDGNGDATFAASLDGPASPWDAVTATATSEEGHTSEFSACVTGAGFDVTAAATEGTVVRGQGASYDVTVSTVAGTVDRDIALSCTGLPAGTSCAFTPAMVRPGATEATSSLVLTTTGPDTPTGASEFAVVAAYGAIERTGDATVTVTDFTLGASPDTVTVTGGQSAGFTVTVSPDGGSFGEEVSLGCSGLPSGASCSFAPQAVTPGGAAATSALTVSTAPLGAVTTPLGGGSAGIPAPRSPLLPLVCLLMAALIMRTLSARSRPVRAGVAALLFIALADLACGGEPTQPVVPDPVTTTFTITGTAGELEQATTATVTVE